MTATHPRLGGRRTAAAALAAFGCLTVAAAGPAAVAPASPVAPASATVSAVVALTGAGPVAAPGVMVTSYLPAVGVELVHGARAALAALAARPGVAGVRPDTAMHPTGLGGDQGGDGAFAWQGLGPAVGRPDTGAGVTVALVDTGVSDTAALNRASGRLVDGVDTSPMTDGGDPRTDGEFRDGFGHGTFLASLLAGGPVPGSGRALGVAPGARVVDVKVADDDGTTSLSAVLAGLDWVASHRPVDVVALALAADAPADAYGVDPLTLAVAHLRASGLVVVVSAGNQAGRLGDPGFAPQALTVGAADTTDGTPSVASFSGSGVAGGVAKPDLLAAGMHLLGLVPPDSVVARSYPNARQPNGLWRGSGTSEATAVAAGVAAAYVGSHPAADPVAVKAALRGAATPLPGNERDLRAGTGLLALPDGSENGDPGEDGFQPWRWWAGGWGGGAWVPALRAAWSTGTWWPTEPGSDPWSGDAWSVKSWSVKSWSVKSWSVKSWSVKSWSVKSWSVKSWSDQSRPAQGDLGDVTIDAGAAAADVAP